MLRNELVETIDRLIGVFKETELEKILQQLVRHEEAQKETPNIALLKGLNLFSIYYRTMNEQAKYILRVFDLEVLADTEKWLGLFNERPIQFDVYNHLRMIVLYLPRFRVLIENAYLRFLKKGKADKKDELMKIILPEPSNLSSPLRIADSLRGIYILYNVCAEINSLPGNDLAVISIDSGSDKILDLLGADKVIRELKDLILSVWDRVVFHRHNKTMNFLEEIKEALPIMEKISELEKEEDIEREKAEILRRNVIEGLNLYMPTGAIIPEQESTSTFQPRELMAPEPKLLTGPALTEESEHIHPPKHRKKTKSKVRKK